MIEDKKYLLDCEYLLDSDGKVTVCVVPEQNAIYFLTLSDDVTLKITPRISKTNDIFFHFE